MNNFKQQQYNKVGSNRLSNKLSIKNKNKKKNKVAAVAVTKRAKWGLK